MKNNMLKYLKIILPTLLVGGILGFSLSHLMNSESNQSSEGPNSKIESHGNLQIESSANLQIWTCSMHPQIRQNEAGDCPICGMDLIPLEANTSNDPLVLQMTNEAVKLASIQTTIVGNRSNQIVKNKRLTGKVQADERLASSQVAHVPGRIEKLYVTFTGEQVNKGQSIATLYSPELITAQRELLEALKLQELNPKLLEAARNKLRYWKIGKSTIEAIEQNGTIQETFTVFADDSGIITNRRVAVGDYVNQGESLFDLMNLRKVWVLFDAYEEDLTTISIGNQIEFTTASIPNKTFKTRITFIDPVINPNTRTASIRTEVNNTHGLLKPEMLVYGNLSTQLKDKVQLTVPKSAVLWTGIRSVVYVKLPDNHIPSFQFREVQIGETVGNNFLVISGLEPGEEVVTYGSFSIDAAAQLNNQASMMNKNVLIKGNDLSIHLPDYTEATPLEFKEQLLNVSEAYLSLKDALVSTDARLAVEAANKIIEAISKVNMSLVQDDAQLYWMEQLNSLNAHGKNITSLEDIGKQREQFDFLSQVLINTIKVYGIPHDTLYVQHCPMAFRDTGADWLSNEKEIRNPYFGDKMMTCGVVKITLDKNYKNPSIQQTPKSPTHRH